MKNRFASFIAGGVLALAAGPALADVILDGGWLRDQIRAPFVNSDGSPYFTTFALTDSAWFRVTDDFIVGDTYFVYDFGGLILTTAFGPPPSNPLGFPGDAFPDLGADAAWANAAYSHGEVLLAPGAHLITIQGDGAGGVPAGFALRADTAVPEPSTLALMGLGGAGLVGWVVRRKRAATVTKA